MWKKCSRLTSFCCCPYHISYKLACDQLIDHRDAKCWVVNNCTFVWVVIENSCLWKLLFGKSCYDQENIIFPVYFLNKLSMQQTSVRLGMLVSWSVLILIKVLPSRLPTIIAQRKWTDKQEKGYICNHFGPIVVEVFQLKVNSVSIFSFNWLQFLN